MMKRLKNLLTAVLVVSAFCVGASAQTPPTESPVARHGQLRVDGNRVVDQHGHPVALRGISYFWSNPTWEGGRFYNAGTVGWLADDWKANVVRAAVNPNPSLRGGYKEVIDEAIAKGIYVIVDWHSHKAHQEYNEARTFFQEIHRDYGTRANIIYEIYNEPCAPRPGDPNFASCAGDDWIQDILPYSQRMVRYIRDTLNTQNIIVLGSGDFSKRVDIATANPVVGTNLVYSIHFYTAEPGTDHQGNLRNWSLSALNRGHAIMATEWGLSEADGGQRNRTKIDTVEAERWFAFMDANQIGWMTWSLCDKNEAASLLMHPPGSVPATGGWNVQTQLTAGGRFIRNKLRFYDNRYALTTTTTGQGTVTRFPNISDGYQPGTPVTLTGAPSAGWSLAGFEISGVVTNNALTISMGSAPMSVRAVFEDNSNLINNGTFTASHTGWVSNGATVERENYQLKVTPGTGANVNDARVVHNNISIVKGNEYELTFDARGLSARAITPRLTNSTRTRDYMPSEPIQLATTMPTNPIKIIFTSDTTLANASLSFNCGGNQTVWFLDNVSLKPTDNVSVVTGVAAARITHWSVVRTGGDFLLRGPAEVGAKVTLYDTRGRTVRTMQARDGLVLGNGSGLGAGNYLLVVQNGSGSEVLRTRVSLVR